MGSVILPVFTAAHLGPLC